MRAKLKEKSGEGVAIVQYLVFSGTQGSPRISNFLWNDGEPGLDRVGLDGKCGDGENGAREDRL